MPEVRVVREGADGARVSWGTPAIPPTTGYVVRRCTLPALRVAHFGNCLVEGLVATSFVDPAPAHDVFYLVSATYGGLEGTLGVSDANRFQVPRVADACDAPSQPGPIDLVVRLPGMQLVCGTEVTIRFPDRYLDHVSARCSGLQAGWIGTTDAQGDVIEQVCADAVGDFGGGEIMRMTFDRSECPIGPDSFETLRCRVLVGNGDCGDTSTVDGACILRVP